MVWNKDLAKLKQELKTDEAIEPKRAVPKPAPKPIVPKELDDEDALFLAAMGKRRQPALLAADPVSAEKDALPPKPPSETADFKEAMASMKGMKPVQPPQVLKKPEAPAPAIVVEVPHVDIEPDEPILLLPPSDEIPAKEAEPTHVSPVLIQLAAGMAIEVDGSLDLRGHSAMDAIERLKERILDGHLLGWRTLHIQLGASEELKSAFQAFLAGPESDLVARYAQAPIPMGGAQAWILYLGTQTPAPR